MIYTTSKVRIKNHQATVDKTIILYRGDRNVEIQFEILENGYREYRVEGTNVILNLNASYGQLIVQKPDNTHIFSDIVPTQDGKVIFTIPRELIDETLEVGQYTFQIRLYNEDQTSRVTLPPVVGGIDIVEPIAIDDSFVDTAMVGYSIAQTDSDDEEDKRFDENGNYIKTYWEHGDIITAGKLNKVEDSLEAINANDIQNHIDVNEKIDALIESIDAAEYITETELNAKGYLTEHQDISGKADKTEIPTKTSQLTNDSGFLNQIPAEYITETELNAKGYLTEHQDISNKVDKVSGKGLSTNDYTTSEKNKLAGIEAGANNVKVYTAKECTTFTSDDGTCTPLAVQKAVGLFPPKEHEHSQYITETELNAKGYATVNQMDNKADKVTGVFYIEGDSTTAGVWTGQHEGITEYYSGLMINYKTNIAGVSGGSTLNINNLGAVQVVRNASTAVTTTYVVDSIINLTYTVDNGTAYWKIADYDVNTKTSSGTSNKTDSKMFIVGATSQSSSGVTTYTNTNCYIGKDNKLYSGGNKVIDSSDMTDRDRLHHSLVPSGTNIPAGSDLNTIDFIKVGSYKCGKNADAKTLLNSPTEKGFMMEVCSPLSTTLDNEVTETWVYRLRTIIDYNGNEWYQYTYSNGTAGNFIYSDWIKKAKVSDIPTKTSQLTNDSDFITSENINSLFDIDYDSLLAFDTTEIISKPNYDDDDDGSNYIDNDNNLILDDDLPAGTYTLKYEFEDGSYSDITSFIIDDDEDNEDVLESLPEGTTYKLNARWSGSTNTTADYNGAIAYKIPINIGENSSLKLTIANLPSVIESNTVNKIYYIDRDGNLVVGYDIMDQNFREVNPSFVSFLNGGKTIELILTPQTHHEYIAVSFLASSGSDAAITEDDMKNFIISLEEIDRRQILTLPRNSTFVHDVRFNESSGTMVENGGLVTIHIPVTGDGNTTYDVNIEGLPNPTLKDSANKIYYQNGDGSYIAPELSNIYFRHMTANEITFADDRKSCNLKITPASGVAYIVLTLLISASNGTYIAVSGKPMLNTVKVSLKPSGGVVNVLEEGEIYLNQRYSQSSNVFTAADGILLLTIPFTNINNDAMILSFSNLKHSLLGSNSGLYILDNNKSNGLSVNGNGAFHLMTSGVEVANDKLSGTVTFVPPINEGYLAIALRLNDTNTAITATDFKDYVITLETVKEGSDEPIEIDVMEEGEILFNKRWSKSAGGIKDELGTLCVSIPIDVDGNTECTLNINNMPISLVTYKDYNMQYFLNADKTVTYDVNNGNGYFGYMSKGWTTSDDGKSGTCVFTPSADMKFMYLNLHIKHAVSDMTITEADIPNISITLIIGGE